MLSVVRVQPRTALSSFLPLDFPENPYSEAITGSKCADIISDPDSWSNSLDKRLSRLMGKLHDHRELYLPTENSDTMTKNLIDRLDELLNKCWTCETTTGLDRIRKHVLALNAEIATGIIAPVKFSDRSSQPKPSIRPTKSRASLEYKPPTMLRSYMAIEITPPRARPPSGLLMVLKEGKLASPNDIFLLPSGQGELSCTNFKKYFPKFSASMSGDLGCELLLYYKYNPTTRRYEFRDAEAENDISELLRLDLD